MKAGIAIVAVAAKEEVLHQNDALLSTKQVGALS